MKKSTKIILFTTLGIVFTVGFFMIVSNFFSEINPAIIFLIYILFLFIILGPFLPSDKKTKTSFAERLGGKIRNSETNEALKFKLRWNLKLSEEYKSPLVMKCKCGFLLTSKMKKCPQCAKLNPDYIESSEKSNFSLLH